MQHTCVHGLRFLWPGAHCGGCLGDLHRGYPRSAFCSAHSAQSAFTNYYSSQLGCGSGICVPSHP